MAADSFRGRKKRTQGIGKNCTGEKPTVHLEFFSWGKYLCKRCIKEVFRHTKPEGVSPQQTHNVRNAKGCPQAKEKFYTDE